MKDISFTIRSENGFEVVTITVCIKIKKTIHFSSTSPDKSHTEKTVHNGSFTESHTR